MMPLLITALTACVSPSPDAWVDWQAPVDTGTDTAIDTGTAVPQVQTTDHCGEIGQDVVWTVADSPHQLTCDVTLEGGSLTIEAGAEVVFASGAALSVSPGGRQAGLLVQGTASAPVVFKSALGRGQGKHGGLFVSPYAGNVELHYLTVLDAGAPGVTVEDVNILADHLTIDGSSGDGLALLGSSELRAGSTALVSTNNGGAGVLANPSAVDTIHIADNDLSGNALEGVWITNGVISDNVTWPYLGVPYVLAGTVVVQGIAPAPAILTIDAGTTFLVENGVGLHLSDNTGAAGLLVQGTALAPVLFTARHAAQGGMWAGISAMDFTLNDGFALHYTTLEYAGTQGQALYVNGTGVLVDHVTLRNNAGYGFYLTDHAWFTLGSNSLDVTGNDWAGSINIGSASTVPTTGDLTGNDFDFIELAPWTTIWGNVSLPPRSVPYWFLGTQSFRTMAGSGSALTVSPGVTVYMDVNATFSFDRDPDLGQGPYGMRAVGTASQPIRFLPAVAMAPGQWGGFTFAACLPGQVVVDHAEVAYAGSADVGAFTFEPECASASFANSELHHSGGWGIFGVTPTLDNVNFHDNGKGPWVLK